MTEKKLNKVLLIDDDKAANFINTRSINKVGLVSQVDVVYNGLEAIVHLESTIHENDAFPDIIFLDVNMPGMNGWEFIESYAPQLEKLKCSFDVVLLTTSHNPDDKLRAEGLKLVSRFVTKPLTEDVLIDIVTQRISKNELMMNWKGSTNNGIINISQPTQMPCSNSSIDPKQLRR